MVAALLLASCAPAVTEEEEVAPPPAEEEEEGIIVVTPPTEEEEVAPGTEMVQNAAGKLVVKPRYGGVLRQGVSSGYEPLYFDPAFGHKWFAMSTHFTNEEVIVGDWAKGPSGTGETSFTVHYLFPAPHIITGLLAESWERHEPDTVILHIRKGVRFHDKPPMNGREFVADDVVFSYKYLWDSPRSFFAGQIPWDTHMESLTAPDKWTVVIECQPGKLAMVYEYVLGQMKILPRETIEEYGDLSDWENACGTGPFLLTDYVKGSSVTLTRNPNYWRQHPLHPEDTMPYLDGIKWLVIPDYSTQLAAIRTGKIDHMFAGWEEAEQLKMTSPELKYLKWHTATASTIFWRVDNPELPCYDIKVRQALSMAVDQQVIIDEFYMGNAELITLPAAPIVEFTDIRTPLKELPESTRELFEFHPDKAKQLLAEAGYPDGFKTSIICISAYVDLLSIVKDYWADVGVDLEIDVKEYGAYIAMGTKHSYEELYIMGAGGGYPFTFFWWTPGSQYDMSLVDDPRINEAKDLVEANYFDETLKRQAMKDIIPYMLDQAYELQLPGVYSYTFWQPWVKGYYGEWQVAYGNPDFAIYVWLDLDLKEEATGKR